MPDETDQKPIDPTVSPEPTPPPAGFSASRGRDLRSATPISVPPNVAPPASILPPLPLVPATANTTTAPLSYKVTVPSSLRSVSKLTASIKLPDMGRASHLPPVPKLPATLDPASPPKTTLLPPAPAPVLDKAVPTTFKVPESAPNLPPVPPAPVPTPLAFVPELLTPLPSAETKPPVAPPSLPPVVVTVSPSPAPEPRAPEKSLPVMVPPLVLPQQAAPAPLPPVPKDRPREISFPEPVAAPAKLEIQMLDKTPQPLLSRRRKPEDALPPGVPMVLSPLALESKTPALKTSLPEPTKEPEPFSKEPAVPTPSETEPKTSATTKRTPSAVELDTIRSTRNRRRAFWLRVVLYPVLVAAVIGLGILAYQNFRETRVMGDIVAPGFTIENTVSIVSDFRREAEALRDELNSLREPILQDLRAKEDVLVQIKSDIAGRTERQTLLQQESTGVEAEVQGIIEDAQKKAMAVWDTEGTALDADYDRLQNDFAARIISRAKSKGLPYQHNEEYKNPEVWVNAFRLALYDAPKALNAVAEREWAEKELTTWRAASKAIDEKRGTLKTKAEAFKASITPRVEQINARVADLRIRIAEAEAEITPLRGEQAEVENVVDEMKKRLASLEPPYREQLAALPARYSKREINVTAKDGASQFFWPKINEDPEFPPGTYWLLVRARRGDELFWGFVPLTIREWTLNQLTITEGTFQPVSDYLKTPATSE